MLKKSIVTGALILTLANVITRLLGFVYRIYMSNVMGAEGMGLYQLILPIYSLAWSVTCSGFTTTVSKLTAQEKAKGEHGNLRRILRQSVAITTSLGLIAGIVLFFCAGAVAQNLLKEPRITLALRLIAVCIPFMASGSCVRGYFFGLQEAIVPAVNQVLEQIVRMAVIFCLAGVFIPMGLAYACVAAALGIVAEEIFSFLFVFVSYRRHAKKHSAVTRTRPPTRSGAQTLALITGMALPLTLNRVAGSLLSAFENALIPRQLQAFGLSPAEALGVYGQVSGMAMPLIYFPSAFLLSLSISLVPAVSEASAVGNTRRINYTASKSMLFASVIGFCAAGMFIVFAGELGTVIYKQDIGHMLTLLGLMCPFLYMQVVLSGILNGLGYQVFIFRNSLISSVITISFVYFLTPRYGVDAFILGWFVSLIVVCALELAKLRQTVDLQFEFINWFIKPVLAAAGSGLTMKWLAGGFIFPTCGAALGLLVSLAAMGGLYMLLIIASGSLSIVDLRSIFKSVRPENG